MNKDLVTYQTYESPKKTGGVIIGVSLLTVGLAILIRYLVLESRKSEGWGCTFPDASNYDPVASKDDGSCKFTNKSQAKATTVGGLLDELFAFGSPPKTDAQQSTEDFIDSMAITTKELEEREAERKRIADQAEADQFFAEAQAEQDRREKEEYEITNLPHYQIP
jgi:hypothetical protein